ncbi:MAG: haloacid dehalogenase-like hydrolase [Ilumatobacteraceae bacterium]
MRYDFGGKTDPLIARDLLVAIGIDDDTYVAKLLAEVERTYDELADELREAIVTLPGVATILDRCGSQAVQSVVTGNIEFVARRKLAAAGFDHHLLLDHGGYGSDHHDRTELVRLALGRLGVHIGRDVDPSTVWVIGDTPATWRVPVAGCRCLLVATGTFDLPALGRWAPIALADLSDVDRVLDLLLG